MNRRRLILLAALVLPACGGEGPSTPSASGRTWESVERTADDGTVIIEKVSYRSEGLRVFGQVCRPAGAGSHAVMVWNHGGFEGLGGEWNGGLCREFARRGYAVVESSYRGEDGSQGSVEVCLGEVSDVLVMLEIALAQPYSDRNRVVLWGASHGGCIALRAFQRGAPVHAAVDVFGPTDLASNFSFWRSQVAAGSPLSAAYNSLIDTATRAAGGTPEQVPAAYAVRSPASYPADLARRREPLLIVHGVEDPLVPASQSCLLAARARGFAAYHVAALPIFVLPTAPSGCEDSGLDWLPGPRPTSDWPGSRYVMVYDSVGHDVSGLAGQAMLADAVSFVVTKTPR